MAVTGRVSKGVVIPDDPSALREGDRVSIRPLRKAAMPRRPRKKLSPLAKRLLKHAGTINGLPSDFARQHDHYIHGTPRR